MGNDLAQNAKSYDHRRLPEPQIRRPQGMNGYRPKARKSGFLRQDVVRYRGHQIGRNREMFRMPDVRGSIAGHPLTGQQAGHAFADFLDDAGRAVPEQGRMIAALFRKDSSVPGLMAEYSVRIRTCPLSRGRSSVSVTTMLPRNAATAFMTMVRSFYPSPAIFRYSLGEMP